MPTILALSVAAVIAGAATFEQIAAWSTDLPDWLRSRFALWRATPSPDRFARVLGLVDADTLDAVLSAWVAARTTALRGAVNDEGDMMHLVAMVDQASGIPLGQVDASRSKGYEISYFLSRIEIRMGDAPGMARWRKRLFIATAARAPTQPTTSDSLPNKP